MGNWELWDSCMNLGQLKLYELLISVQPIFLKSNGTTPQKGY